MKQMSLIEMDGFLKGKCIPRDLKVNETNAEYLVRKFSEAEAKCAALAAENAGLNKFIVQSCYVFDGQQDELSDAYICAIDGRMPQIPATDAFLADVRAGAFNDLCAAFVRHAKIAGLDDGDLVTVKEATDALLHCAEQLREGFKQ
ncbi:TPA: hypothetical protein JQR10_004029 [Shigella flexneri]|nr:hypothetical protein [Escherichia coli]HAY5382359.1 hypothetical protein [Shigella flexneri]